MAAAPSPTARLLSTHDLPPDQPLPLYSGRVPAGFPSPAEEHLGDTLDLQALLVARPAATFFVRVSGPSLTGIGVHDDDILVVDRSLTPRSGQIVIATVDGELTVEVLAQDPAGIRLLPANPNYSPIELSEGQELNVWGVVTGLVRTGLAGGVDVRTLRCE